MMTQKYSRKVYASGKIAIPIKLCRELNIWQGDAIEITTENDFIVLRKYKKTANDSSISKAAQPK